MSPKTLGHSENLNELILDMQVQHEKDKKEAEVLEEQIDEWRKKMIDSAALYGFISSETLHCSEQLDTLIFQMQILREKERKTRLRR